jgi:NAD(P)H-flavin reductase/ferredoxin
MSDAFLVTVEPGGHQYSAMPGERLLDAAIRSGVWVPFECGWGSCGTCKVALVEGSVYSTFVGAPAETERDVRRGRVLMCQSAATSDVVVRALRVDSQPHPDRPTKRIVSTVRSVQELGPSIFQIRFDLGEAMSYKPGQFVIVHGPEGDRRCYSIAGHPADDDLRLILKAYPRGEMSMWMSALSESDEVVIDGPYGDVFIRDGDRPVVLIAGGTGISAVISLMREVSTQSHRPVTVIYGGRAPEELVVLDELRECAARHGAVEIRTVTETPSSATHTGRVTDALDGIDLAGADVYLAGPPAMVDAVSAALDTRGCQRDRVFVDRFG